MKLRPTALFTLVFITLCSVVLVGCHAYARLYPITGPLAQQTPPPVFKAKVTGKINIDNFYAELVNQEHVSCTFTRLRWNKSSVYPGSFDFKPVWNAVYGDKFFEGHILGANNAYYWCDSTGNKGTVIHVAIQLDMVKDMSRSQGVKGVVADDKGNIYKIAF